MVDDVQLIERAEGPARGLSLLVFPPGKLGVILAPVRGRENRATLIRAREALARDGRALAVLNGPMFSARRYRPGEVATITYRHEDDAAGVAETGGTSTDRRGFTISVVDGRALVSRGDSPDPASSVAVQLYPSLVESGRNVATETGSNDERLWRSALCVMRDGSLAFAVQVNTMRGFAGVLIAEGADHAGYTDGGGSTSLLVKGKQRRGAREDRPVPTWLAVLDRRGGGNGMLVLALAAGAAWWLSHRGGV